MSTLRAGLAVTDPPFDGTGAGLDIDLITAIAEQLGDTAEFVELTCAGRDEIFAALDAGACDCVASVTELTEVDAARNAVACAPPYLVSGQALVVDGGRLPQVRSVDDLAGLTVAVQRGGTGQQLAEKLLAEGRVGQVRVYEPGNVRAALADLGAGGADAVMALAPVLTELVRPLAGVEVVQRGLSADKIAIAVARSSGALLDRIVTAQAELEHDGTLQRIRRKWLGNPFTDQALAVH